MEKLLLDYGIAGAHLCVLVWVVKTFLTFLGNHMSSQTKAQERVAEAVITLREAVVAFRDEVRRATEREEIRREKERDAR